MARGTYTAEEYYFFIEQGLEEKKSLKFFVQMEDKVSFIERLVSLLKVGVKDNKHDTMIRIVAYFFMKVPHFSSSVILALQNLLQDTEVATNVDGFLRLVTTLRRFRGVSARGMVENLDNDNTILQSLAEFIQENLASQSKRADPPLTKESLGLCRCLILDKQDSIKRETFVKIFQSLKTLLVQVKHDNDIESCVLRFLLCMSKSSFINRETCLQGLGLSNDLKVQGHQKWVASRDMAIARSSKMKNPASVAKGFMAVSKDQKQEDPNILVKQDVNQNLVKKQETTKARGLGELSSLKQNSETQGGKIIGYLSYSEQAPGCGPSPPRYPVTDGTVLGRAQNCQISIKDPRLSRLHIVFLQSENDRVFIKQLSLKNKLKVNGQVLRAGDHCMLLGGENILVINHRFSWSSSL